MRFQFAGDKRQQLRSGDIVIMNMRLQLAFDNKIFINFL